jgi:Domain of unknown function (DUF397)
MAPKDLEVTGLQWRTARRSAGNGACVEVAPAAGAILVRDSQDRPGPVVQYSGKSWHLFLQAAKKGQYNLERL